MTFNAFTHLYGAGFLMHRVELKDKLPARHPLRYPAVPNAPCGVESLAVGAKQYYLIPFLMHRVELKVYKVRPDTIEKVLFLMHRVELKESYSQS